MAFQIKVPAVGESITEGTISEWQKNDGDQVERDEVLFVLETDKASVEVVSETAGVLKTKAKAGDVVKIGSVVGEIEEDASGGKAAAKKETPKEEKAENKPAAKAEGKKASTNTEDLSPAVRKMVTENDVDTSTISGSGRGGRITKGDVIEQMKSPAPAKKETAPAPIAKAQTLQPVIIRGSQEIEREPMSTIRKRIAERLVQAQHTAAILTTFNEVDMSTLMELRKRYKETFEKKYNVSLGFMGFFVKAVIEALKEYPKVNAFIEGSDIVYHRYTNIGIAVGGDRGLVVPVLKNAESMSLAQIEMSIKAYGQKARDGKLTIDEMSGGTFTISNGGVYGSLMSTPILNPPQSGILGMHKIEERPIAVGGQVVIRPMMYVALSYDHRIIDGSESVRFLVKVKEGLEDPNRMLLEI